MTCLRTPTSIVFLCNVSWHMLLWVDLSGYTTGLFSSFLKSRNCITFTPWIVLLLCVWQVLCVVRLSIVIHLRTHADGPICVVLKSCFFCLYPSDIYFFCPVKLHRIASNKSDTRDCDMLLWCFRSRSDRKHTSATNITIHALIGGAVVMMSKVCVTYLWLEVICVWYT